MEMSFLSVLLMWFSCHLIGDFAFQSTWMVEYKGKSWEILAYHSLTYTAPFVIAGFFFGHASQIEIHPIAYATLLVTHIFIDAAKARWKYIKSIWVDQLLHGFVIVSLLVTGWL